MNERPILMSTDMVPPTLDGRKTQTRRIINPQPPKQFEHVYLRTNIKKNKKDCTRVVFHDNISTPMGIDCPFGKEGDRLWVRETWFCNEDDEACAQDLMSVGQGVYYKASEENPDIFPKWRPSIHMPRWASRIDLLIHDITVERLVEITEDDARAEGFKSKSEFRNYMEKKYPGSWDLNPWVWVIEFERIKL